MNKGPQDNRSGLPGLVGRRRPWSPLSLQGNRQGSNKGGDWGRCVPVESGQRPQESLRSESGESGVRSWGTGGAGLSICVCGAHESPFLSTVHPPTCLLASPTPLR